MIDLDYFQIEMNGEKVGGFESPSNQMLVKNLNGYVVPVLAQQLAKRGVESLDYKDIVDGEVFDPKSGELKRISSLGEKFAKNLCLMLNQFIEDMANEKAEEEMLKRIAENN